MGKSLDSLTRRMRSDFSPPAKVLSSTPVKRMHAIPTKQPGNSTDTDAVPHLPVWERLMGGGGCGAGADGQGLTGRGCGAVDDGKSLMGMRRDGKGADGE